VNEAEEELEKASVITPNQNPNEKPYHLDSKSSKNFTDLLLGPQIPVDKPAIILQRVEKFVIMNGQLCLEKPDGELVFDSKYGTLKERAIKAVIDKLKGFTVRQIRNEFSVEGNYVYVGWKRTNSNR